MPQSNNSDHLLSRIEKLNSIGIALSSEKDSSRLQEMILTSAKAITQSDGGTLYTVGEDNHLHFEIIRATSLDIKMGGPAGEEEVNFEPIPMYLPSGAPNDHWVVVYAALHDETINIPDVYKEQSFDFSGPKNFDRNTGYRSRFFLAVPMKNHENDIIGVLQLINKQESGNGDIAPYTREDQQLAESLASQAAVALTNKKLIDSLQTLFDSFIKSIATGIDEKSAYAGGHCNRVPALAMMLANAASRENSGPFKRFSMSEDERYSLEVASWLHDCGKVTTPEYVVDKATKLETIFDRIHLIDTRFEVLKRDAHIRKLERLLQADEEQKQAIEKEDQEEIRQIWSDMEFIRKINHGVESMNPDDKERARQIGKRTWANSKGEHEPFLSENELSNLQITTGTLTLAEHEILKNHVNVSSKYSMPCRFPNICGMFGNMLAHITNVWMARATRMV